MNRFTAHEVNRRLIKHKGSVSRPRQSTYDLWWIKWHWDGFLSEAFGFTLPISLHSCCTFIRASPGGWTMGPLAAAVPETVSPHRNTTKKKSANKVHTLEILQPFRDPSYVACERQTFPQSEGLSRSSYV
jgi:hypothetical protein